MRSKQQPRPSYRRSTHKDIDNVEEEEEINRCSETNDSTPPPSQSDTDQMQGDKSILNATFLHNLKELASAEIAIKTEDHHHHQLPIIASLTTKLSEHVTRLNESVELQDTAAATAAKQCKIEPEANHATYRNNNRSNSVRGEDVLESELGSPTRCQSRESSASTGRQSADSNTSGNGSMGVQSIGLPLPSNMASTAVLSTHQSAAMAAYLNAAVAVQQNRFMMSAGNPNFAANLVHSTQSSTASSLSSPVQDDGSVLDFSTKRTRGDSDTDSKSECEASIEKSMALGGSGGGDSSPLDLSTGGRNRSHHLAEEASSLQPPPRKLPRSNEYKPMNAAVWAPMNPYLAAVAAASISPKNEWNSKTSLIANEATKALEKMSEMTKLGSGQGGGGGADHHEMRSSSNSHSSSANNRHSAWQSHWLNKGADAAKDVFKCVWCKQSFPTLATLTTHMKETQHCGVNVPPPPQQNQAPPSSAAQLQQHHHHHNDQASGTPASKSDLSLLIKETMPLPRKLVRGQDVWLGKGAEQTRQILKCMWCGQSFRSLAEMTSHMQQTQHYTNIISQEQIISWKSSEEKGGGGGSGANPGLSASGNANSSAAPANSSVGANNTVSAVLTCKVCDQAFSSLKDLSNHMVKNAHYKEHIMKSITESGGRKRQTREKRKKSLPVRKLLELERSQSDGGAIKPELKSPSGGATTRITCEKCGEKIETAQFVDHIRQCVDGVSARLHHHQQHQPKPPIGRLAMEASQQSRKNARYDKSVSPAPLTTTAHPSPHASPVTTAKDGTPLASSDKPGSSASVLNAIEQLIEKSFDSRTRQASVNFSMHNQSAMPLGSSILKRLGIDESVDYTKPLMDAQTMNLLRSYQQQPLYIKRERSGSESSSVSDRGSSTRLESLTPERKFDVASHETPRQSPIDKDAPPPITVKSEHGDDVKPSLTPASTPTSNRPESSSHHLTVLSPSSHSPCSERSLTPRSPKKPSGAAEHHKKLLPASLTALSSMFDNLNGSSPSSSAALHNDGASGSGGRTDAAHPLAALQKLCDKTETNNPSAGGRAGSGSASATALSSNLPASNSASASGSMLAFSWACNEAAGAADSIFKCSFCDTSYSSKGAYRHHLSKAHFISNSDATTPAPNDHQPTSLLKSGSSAEEGRSSVPISESPSKRSSYSPKVATTTALAPPPHPSHHHSHSASHADATDNAADTETETKFSPSASAASGSQNPPTGDDSPHSKFLKYTELAKQLSSKYV